MTANDSIHDLPDGVVAPGIYRDFEGDYWQFDGTKLHLLTTGPDLGEGVRPSARVAGEYEAAPRAVEPFEWVGA